MEQDAIPDGLRALARANGVATLDVSGLRQLQGGNSSEIWAFDGHWVENGTQVERPLVLRAGMANEFAFGGRGAEFGVMKALEGAGVPAPRAYWFDADGTFLGRPSMVTDRCPGAADRNLMNAHNKLGLTQDDRVAIGGQMMALLARLHSVDGSAMEEGVASSAEEQLRQHDEAIARLEAEPMVELRFASWWLWRNRPPPVDRPAIVHGDYRPANMLVEGARISAMLDWEFTHLGDPLEDLGWYLTPFYSAEHLIPGVFGPEEALQSYEAARGESVDRAAVHFWSVFAMYKLAYMTVAALRWLVDGDASRMAASAEFIIGPLLTAIGDPAAQRRLAA